MKQNLRQTFSVKIDAIHICKKEIEKKEGENKW